MKALAALRAFEGGKARLIPLGRILMIAGALLLALGAVLTFADKAGGPGLGRLPGDIVFRKDDFAFYFPLGTSILLSVILSILFWIFRK